MSHLFTMVLSAILFFRSCPREDPKDDTGDTAAEVVDADSDGYNSVDDCNDFDASIYPDAREVCDELDNDCDGFTDDDDARVFGRKNIWYQDADGDGYGNPTETIRTCAVPSGYTADATDCDDSDASIYPSDYGNPEYVGEICDGADNDCDGYIDEATASDVTIWYQDGDGDGYGTDLQIATASCEAPDSSHANNSDDCDDANSAINPGTTEICNGYDDDCNGWIDNDDPNTGGYPTWYRDEDSDGWGTEAGTTEACTPPTGYTEYAGDCDDSDPAYNPGADESDCTDPNDYNCDGVTGYTDSDSDGYVACEECDDADATVNPTASEYCDTVDNNCDGAVDEDDAVDAATWYADSDSDRYGNAAVTYVSCSSPSFYVSNATDCDDTSADAYPGATEYCDSADNDCDGTSDEDDAADATTWYYDADSDGYGDTVVTHVSCSSPSSYVAYTGDCDDTDPAYNPGATESDCADPNDYNCDGVTGYSDTDSDGFAACEECDDTNAAINPDADEVCDSADNDCDGTVDEDDAVDATTWYADSDSDRYGNAAVTYVSCSSPSSYVSNATDCDDTDASIRPGAPEYCDDTDNDCDGAVDENGAVDALTIYPDTDSDGYGVSSGTLRSCEVLSGYATVNTDCNDSDAEVNPEADEVCDSVDNNCNMAIDEPEALDATTWYPDADSDGYGDRFAPQVSCVAHSGYLAEDGDCDDADASINPDADEYCDGVDDDCDGTVDNNAVDGVTYYQDYDGDGYGNGIYAVSCSAVAGHVLINGDCDDTDAGIFSGADEVCDSADNDCDGDTDEDDAVDATTWYADADSDGYGDASTTHVSCSSPSSYVSDATDCDDSDSGAYPGATEYCDSDDNDCDGATDEAPAADAATWYRDADSDGYGTTGLSTVSCTQPSGFVGSGTDCDDSDANVNPGQSETCNGTDDDCDGSADEDMGGAYWYADDDLDGYGDPATAIWSCSSPPSYVSDSSDCDDVDDETYPGADEYCDEVDNDCDGDTDEDDAVDAATWYADADSDEYGDATATYTACEAPNGYVDNATDCDDTDDEVYPDADEVCGDGVDQDCDGTADNTWSCEDVDEDGILNGEDLLVFMDANGDGYDDACIPGFLVFFEPYASSSVFLQIDERTYGLPFTSLVREIAMNGDVDSDGTDDSWCVTASDFGQTSTEIFRFVSSLSVDDYTSPADPSDCSDWLTMDFTEYCATSGYACCQYCTSWDGCDYVGWTPQIYNDRTSISCP